jgi:hypothetical protein
MRVCSIFDKCIFHLCLYSVIFSYKGKIPNAFRISSFLNCSVLVLLWYRDAIKTVNLNFASYATLYYVNVAEEIEVRYVLLRQTRNTRKFNIMCYLFLKERVLLIRPADFNVSVKKIWMDVLNVHVTILV